jgi:hypothetical protein
VSGLDLDYVQDILFTFDTPRRCCGAVVLLFHDLSVEHSLVDHVVSILEQLPIHDEHRRN